MNEVDPMEKARGRNIALSDSVFEPLKAEAKRDDISIASIIREALEMRAVIKAGA